MISTAIQSIGWLLILLKMSLNLSFASERMQAAERSQLRRLLSSDDFNRRRGVAMSITVSISAVKSHTQDIDADEMSNSRHSPSLISISVGTDHLCCRKPHRSLRSFLLTGTIFLSFPVTLLVFSRADHCTSEVLTTSL